MIASAVIRLIERLVGSAGIRALAAIARFEVLTEVLTKVPTEIASVTT